MIKPSTRPLRASLIILLVLAMIVSSSVVGGLILLVRLPQITAENYASIQYQANELSNRINALMDTLETRVVLMADTAKVVKNSELPSLLNQFVISDSAFSAVYLLNKNGLIEAVGLPSDQQKWRADIHNRDLSSTKIFLASQKNRNRIWLDKHISVLAGNKTVALAVPVNDKLLIAEIPITYILKATRISSGVPDLSTWILDQYGEVIVDTDGILGSGVNNLMNMPVIHAAINQEALPITFTYRNKNYHPASARAERIDWVFFAKMPAGLDNKHIQTTLIDMLALFCGSIIISLLLAPWWAERMAKPLRALMNHARRVSNGNEPGSWPHGNIQEFNALSANLAQMAITMQEREQKFLAIFNDTPVAMLVTNPSDHFRILEVNQAWEQQFGHARQLVIGRTCTELNLWPNSKSSSDFIRDTPHQSERIETALLHHDGHEILCMMSSKLIYQAKHPMMITAMENISERRRMERELRQLTVELEQRVKRRTEDLERSNSELTNTLESLRQTQTELVRAEKLAALGELVAGVAHELNTPLGNSIMAISTLKDQAKDFTKQLAEGIKRSTLDKYLANVSMASEIADRNLVRAAELVNSFKQVAVDQTSSQRRQFNLKAVLDEILLTLRPTFKRTPYQVETEIPENLTLDSYPGPLGQAITNLITNALLHGFDERDHGKVFIRAKLYDEKSVCIYIQDDGRGIAEEVQDKVFTPFFTTKMGRGGTGLGLHIVHNTVTQILGGTINMESTEGLGTLFTIMIPIQAPKLRQVES